MNTENDQPMPVVAGVHNRGYFHIEKSLHSKIQKNILSNMEEGGTETDVQCLEETWKEW